MAAGAEAVAFDGHTFFDYRPDGETRPYVDALYSPAGLRVTRDIATAPEGSDDHAHHKGVWWGHRNVSGSDVWTEFDGHGRIRSDGEPTVERRDDRVELTHTMSWLAADGTPLLQDARVLRAWKPDGRGAQALDIELRLSPIGREVQLSDTKEAGLIALRVAPELEERRGGRITLSSGAVGEAAAWGRPAAWCDYSGTIDGAEVGVAVFDHPENPLPAYWHVRDYGLLAVNPFGLRDFDESSAESGAVTLLFGASLVSRYRIFVHDGAVDLDGYYAAYREGV